MKFTHSAQMTVLLVLAALVSVSLAQSGENKKPDNSERWQQNYLFTMKDAYLLDAGRGRVSFESAYWQNRRIREVEAGAPKKIDRDQYLMILGLEWGLLPGLQGDIELPVGYAWQNGASPDTTFAKGDIGDLTGGLTLALGQQESTSWVPSVAARVGATAQTSDAERGVDKGAWGWDGSLLASKAFDDFFWHANATYRALDNTREFGQTGKADEQYWLFGFALVYSPKQGYEASCETTYQTETEKTKIETEHRHAWTITPGFNVDLSPYTKLGAGFPIGVGGETYDWGFLIKLQVEI